MALLRASPDTSLPFEPGGVFYDWARPQDRTFAARASERRIGESFQTTIALQADPLLADARRGFFWSTSTRSRNGTKAINSSP